MQSKDTELDALAAARDRASEVRTEWKVHLDGWYEHLSSLRSENDPRIDSLGREGDDLYQRMVDAVTRSKECYASGDHGGAGACSAEAKALKAQLAEVNGEKNGLSRS
jgi:hypothetical protein